MQPGQRTRILEYSRSPARRRGVAGWCRTLWSHEARVDAAQTVSVKQGFALLGAISLAAAALSTTHSFVHVLIIHAFSAQPSLEVLKHDLGAQWLSAAHRAIFYAPLYFCALVFALVLLALLWARLIHGHTHWARTFPVLSVGCVPLLWFFVLFQIEGLAPFLAKADVLRDLWWNPITNYVRFAALMIAILLLTAWIVDAARLYHTLRRRELAAAAPREQEQTTPEELPHASPAHATA